MPRHLTTPEHGLAGIQALLDLAQPGDIVECLPGRYEGTESLSIGKNNIELTGSDDPDQPSVLLLSINLIQPVGISVNNVRHVHLQHLQIQILADTPPGYNQPFCAIKATYSSDCFFTDLRITGEQSPYANQVHGISCYSGENNRIYGCYLFRLRLGISFSNNQGFVCESNHCIENATFGVGSVVSCGRVSSNNSLLANHSHGLSVLIDPDTGISSNVDAEGNLAEGNKVAGISYFGSLGRVSNNRLIDNQMHGLGVLNHVETGTPSNVDADSNHVEGNQLMGISYTGSRGKVSKNCLFGNLEDGLSVKIDAESGTPSEADVDGNLAEGNQRAGITYIGSYGHARNNLVFANRIVGFLFYDTPSIVSINATQRCICDNRLVGNHYDLGLANTTIMVSNNLYCLNEALLTPDSLSYHIDGFNNLFFDTSLNSAAPNCLSLQHELDAETSLPKCYCALHTTFGEVIAQTVMSGGVDLYIRNALAFPTQPTLPPKPRPGNCYLYHPPELNHTEPGATSEPLWQDVRLQACTSPNRIETMTGFADAFRAWLDDSRAFPSYWCLLGAVPLDELQERFAASLNLKLEDAPLKTRLSQPRYRWLRVQGFGGTEQAFDDAATNTVVAALMQKDASVQPDGVIGLKWAATLPSNSVSRCLLVLFFAWQKLLPQSLLLLTSLFGLFVAGLGNPVFDGQVLIAAATKMNDFLMRLLDFSTNKCLPN